MSEMRVNNIYIWDYINNFDDYLTPFPILKIAQQRLQFFKQHGASGIFFNGSGYSYSSFDEMIFYPYGEDPKSVPQICSLISEFHFHVQFEIPA